MTDQGLLVMPIYLTIAFVANILFLYRAIGDNLNVRRQVLSTQSERLEQY